MKKELVEYGTLLTAIKQRIRSAQYEALRSVNKELISLYWDIGKIIVDRLKVEKRGKSVVINLAKDLQAEFRGVAGFSSANLWRMKQFYEEYAENTKLAPLVRVISWTKNIAIMEKCKDNDKREFYLRKTISLGWSKNVLIHQIENRTYENTVLSQTNFEQTLPVNILDHAGLELKDEYTFDFLDLGDRYNERQLEQAILSKIEPFLLEMGGVFSFIGSQYRIEVSNKEYFIDLLLYHRRLKSLVAIELKIGEFLPEYVGKMQFYLAIIDDRIKMDDENPSIGVIICKCKDKTIVEYALKESNKPIGVATYRIVNKLPVYMAKELPTPEQMAKLI